MSDFYITLDRATNIKRDADGVPFAWKGGKKIAEFSDPEKLKEYVTDNIGDLVDVVAFTGSATLLNAVNSFIATELKKAGLL